MPFDAAELQTPLDEAGSPVTLGSTTINALVDRPGDAVLEGGGAGGVQSTDVVLTIVTGTLPGLLPGASITVDGVAMKVRAFESIDDGAYTRIHCASSL